MNAVLYLEDRMGPLHIMVTMHDTGNTFYWSAEVLFCWAPWKQLETQKQRKLLVSSYITFLRSDFLSVIKQILLCQWEEELTTVVSLENINSCQSSRESGDYPLSNWSFYDYLWIYDEIWEPSVLHFSSFKIIWFVAGSFYSLVICCCCFFVYWFLTKFTIIN